MAYCTVDQVQTWLAHVTFDEEDYPTRTQITDELITVSDAHIDARLSAYHTVPLTDASDIIVLRGISVGLTAGQIARILYGERGDADGNSVLWKLYDEAVDLLECIIKGELKMQTARKAFVSLGVFVAHDQTSTTPENRVTMGMDF